MADVNRGNRPLSPHLEIYRPQLHSALSIFHRITGVALTGGAFLTIWWLLAAATGPEYFATADWVVTSFIGDLVMFGSMVALWYHFCNGLRHLYWDTGRGFDPEAVTKSGIIGLICTGLLSILTLILVV